MSEQQRAIERTYEEAKRGEWEQILSWPRGSSRELIRLGAAARRLSCERQSAAYVAKEQKYRVLVELLRRAARRAESLWKAPDDPNLVPSSRLWGEAAGRRASEVMYVAYGGGVIKIPAGSCYFVDSFERTLVGWHGTYNPPAGMDGEPMV